MTHFAGQREGFKAGGERENRAEVREKERREYTAVRCMSGGGRDTDRARGKQSI